MATGLVVNERPNIRAPYYRQARAMCNSLFRTGEFYFGAQMRWRESKDGSATVVGNVNQLRGILNHIYHVKKYRQEQSQEDRPKGKQERPKGIDLLMERFLCFEKFHNLSKPLVVCEGNTDIVYLECALRSLASEFSSMIQVRGGRIEWKIDFYKYSKGNMSIGLMRGGRET